jgi:hypothetical protein
MDGNTLHISIRNDNKKPKRLTTMRVLIACETSGRTREAFRKLGHDAWSCDINPSEDDSPFHWQSDIIEMMRLNSWMDNVDLMIAHPPCTYLCNSGVWALKYRPDSEVHCVASEWPGQEFDGDRWLNLELARALFMTLWEAPIPKICIENPVPHKYGNLPKYSQTIQPYMFGDDASKRTCLWLKGLPKLIIPSQSLWQPPRIVDGNKRWANQTDSGQNRLGPSETRASERSRTYEGIANAFASNWGGLSGMVD